MSEDELRYVYNNPTGRNIFTPIYKKYRDYFTDLVVEHTTQQAAFSAYKETGVFERYWMNAAQFSAAKNASETSIMQSELFGPGGKLKSFEKFKKDVESLNVVKIENEVHMRVEYETCRRNVIAGNAWSRMEENADIYPYWIWEGRLDKRERPEHREMEGKAFRIGDKNGDKLFPPKDWNCRCEGVPIDEHELAEKKLKVSTTQEAEELLTTHVPENFRYNAAHQGPMPKDHSYFNVLPNANAADYKTFGGDSLDKGTHLRRRLAGKGLHYIMEIVHGWRDKYHVDDRHDLVFQNKATFANVRLSDGIIHEIAKYPGGFEQLPATIEHPTEIWGSWEDVHAQKVALRTYIHTSSIYYIVQTRDGRVTNAFQVSRSQVDNFRKGVILT